jgi:tryptophan synthase alpha chain
MGELEAKLRRLRDGGGASFVPYVTGGVEGVDDDLLRAIEAAGADAVEVGIPHSDPIMDGGVIQEASARALAAGTKPADVLSMIRKAGLSIPVVVMTYANPVERRGEEGFVDDLIDAGVSAAIVPDLPVDEAWGFAVAAASRGVDAVLLAAPGTALERLRMIADAAHGFVYCVATYGVTGARDQLEGTAREVVEALRPLTDLPLLVGVGIATPEQAAAACTFADGVIVGSAMMTPLLRGDRRGAMKLVAEFRDAIPRG